MLAIQYEKYNNLVVRRTISQQWFGKYQIFTDDIFLDGLSTGYRDESINVFRRVTVVFLFPIYCTS